MNETQVPPPEKIGGGRPATRAEIAEVLSRLFECPIDMKADTFVYREIGFLRQAKATAESIEAVYRDGGHCLRGSLGESVHRLVVDYCQRAERDDFPQPARSPEQASNEHKPGDGDAGSIDSERAHFVGLWAALTAEQQAAAVERAKARMAQAGRPCRNDDPTRNRLLRALIYNELCSERQAAGKSVLRLAMPDNDTGSEAEPCKAAV